METGNEIFRALGITVVHSLWQGAVLSVFMLLVSGTDQQVQCPIKIYGPVFRDASVTDWFRNYICSGLPEYQFITETLHYRRPGSY